MRSCTVHSIVNTYFIAFTSQGTTFSSRQLDWVNAKRKVLLSLASYKQLSSQAFTKWYPRHLPKTTHFPKRLLPSYRIIVQSLLRTQLHQKLLLPLLKHFLTALTMTSGRQSLSNAPPSLYERTKNKLLIPIHCTSRLRWWQMKIVISVVFIAFWQTVLVRTGLLVVSPLSCLPYCSLPMAKAATATTIRREAELSVRE